MSRAPKLAFTISPARPDKPREVSNTVVPPVAPMTIHIGGHSPKAAATKAAPKPDPVDPNAEKKRRAAEAVRKKAAESARAAEAREKEAARKAEEERQAREQAKADRLARARAASEAAKRPAKSATTVKEEAKAKRMAEVAPTPTPQATPTPPTAAPVEMVVAEAAAPRPQPMPMPAQGYSKAHVQRAELLAAYAARLGVHAMVSDLLEAFTGAGEDIDPRMMAAGLAEAGLSTDVAQVAEIKPKLWPALALMTSGHVVLVLAQKGDVLTVYDRSAPDQSVQVPLYDFAPFFSGTLVRAGKSLDQLTAEHTPLMARDHWFWGRFAAYKRQIGEIALGSLVANMLAVAVALFSLQVYDRVIPHQSQSTLWVLALGVSLAIAFEAILKLARSRLMDGAGRQIELGVQSMLMDRLLGMRSDARPAQASGLFASMREFASVREFFTSSTIGTLADVPFILMFFLLVASIAGPLVWLLVLGGILMVIPGFLLQKRMMRLSQETQGASTRASRLLQEAVSELDTIKTQRGEDRIRRIWDELNILSAAKSAEQRKLAGVLTFWSQAVQQLTYVGAVVVGTYLVFAGEFTVGTIIATGILTSRTLAPLTQLSGTLARWTNVKTALDALDAIATAPQDKATDRKHLRRERIGGDYALREVQFRYDPDGAPTLDIPAVDIKQGQKIALLGANGSGKSTFLKMLAGLYAPTQGRLMLDNAEMAQLDPRDVRRNVGYLGQDVRLFAGTLRENLDLAGRARDDAHLLAALDFAGLGDFVRRHPRGLDIDIRDGGEGLSVGQRQSIGWARLWLQDPAVCLLDEPTAALDQTLEVRLVRDLDAWLAGRTAIIATHRLPIVGLSDRVMVFNAGRMVVDGPRDQVMAHLAKGAAQ